MSRCVTLFGWQDYGSRNRAGFHHLARAYSEEGADVQFITVGVSLLSILGHHGRRKLWPSRFHRPHKHADGVTSLVARTILHPAASGSARIDSIIGPVFRRWTVALPPHLRERVQRSELILFESSPALAYVSQVASEAPDALLVYRMSDSLEAVNAHPVLLDFERTAWPLFDLISCPTREFLAGKPLLPQPVIHPHGLDPALFAPAHGRPHCYAHVTNALFVGMDSLDLPSVCRIASARPALGVHVVGPFNAPQGCPPNLIFHGLMPYEETIPLIQHADVALNTVTWSGVQAQRASLKVMQFDAVGLPIVSPVRPLQRVQRLFPYTSGDPDSAISAVDRAIAAGRAHGRMPRQGTWADLARDIEATARERRHHRRPDATASLGRVSTTDNKN